MCETALYWQMLRLLRVKNYNIKFLILNVNKVTW